MDLTTAPAHLTAAARKDIASALETMDFKTAVVTVATAWAAKGESLGWKKSTAHMAGLFVIEQAKADVVAALATA